MTEIVKNAVMSIKRMSVILWCVASIVLIVFLSLYYGQTAEGAHGDGVMYTAMTLIAALGGVDVWKARKDIPSA